MKWAPVQVCVYLARPMRRRCSVIGLFSGIYSQAEFSHCQKKTKCPLTVSLSDRPGKFRKLWLPLSSLLLSFYCIVPIKYRYSEIPLSFRKMCFTEEFCKTLVPNLFLFVPQSLIGNHCCITFKEFNFGHVYCLTFII